MDKRKCLYCSTPIAGRSDKKFCNYSCRNSFNNIIRNNRGNPISRINKLLKNNWGILNELEAIGTNKKPIPKSTMLAMGFHFEYFTHIHTEADGTQYNCCYNYAYRIKGEDVIIIKHEVPTL